MANFPQYVNNGPKILVVRWIEGWLALLFVALGVFTRTRLVRAFGWEDAMNVAAMVRTFLSSWICSLPI